MLTPTRLVLVVMASNVSTLALAPFRAALLGPAGRGELALVQTWISLLALAGALGVRQALYEASPSRGNVETVDVRPGIALCLATSASVAVVLFLLNGGSTELAWILVLAAAVGVFYAVYQLEVASAQLDGRHLHCLLLLAVPAWIDLALSIPALLAGFYSVRVALTIIGLVELVRLSTAVSVRLARESNRVRVAGFWRRAARLTPLSFLPAVAGQSDVVILAMIYETKEIGPYALAKMAYSIMLLPGTVLEGRVVSQSRAESVKSGATYWLKLASGVGVLACAVGVTTAWGIRQFFSDDFALAALYAPVLAASGAVAVAITLMSAVAVSRGRARTANGLLAMQIGGLLVFYCANSFTQSILASTVINTLLLVGVAVAGAISLRRSHG